MSTNSHGFFRAILSLGIFFSGETILAADISVGALLPSTISAAPGGTANLKLHFVLNTAVSKNYDVFIHVLDRQRQSVVRSVFQPPQATSVWRGDIQFSRSLTLPSKMILGNYTIVAGLSLSTGKIILNPVLGASNFIEATGTSNRRYTVGKLSVVKVLSPTPTPTPTPTPQPVPQPTPDPVPPPVSTSCSGVQIYPTDSADKIQSLMDQSANGTTFCFNPGTYLSVNHYINMKSGSQMICSTPRACILDGQNKYAGVFASYGPYGTGTQQLIRGFVIRNYLLYAKTDYWLVACIQLRALAVAENNEISNCQTGIEMSTQSTARSNWIHHNRQYGISGGPGDRILIEGNEVSFNNTGHYDPNNDAGGSKIVGTRNSPFATNLVWRNNNVHDNWGNGIWSDGNVIDAVYENNVISNNMGAGIHHEISWAATIRGNTVVNNNLFNQGKDLSCWHGAQILVTNSQGVNIQNNSIEATNVNALCLVNSTSRVEPSTFPQSLAKITVSGNSIKMRGTAKVGVAADVTPPSVNFQSNSYWVDSTTRTFWQWMKDYTRSQWQSSGMDTQGQFLSW